MEKDVQEVEGWDTEFETLYRDGKQIKRLLGSWWRKKVSWCLLRPSELAGFHPNI